MRWEKVPFGELFACPTRNGVYKSKEYHGTGVKIINMGEVFANDFIEDQEMQRIAMTEEEMRTSSVQNGDLLFARRSLVESGAGKTTFVRRITEPTTFESSIIRVRLDPEKCYPLFYLYWLRSIAGRTAIAALVTGTNVKGIRGSELKDILVDRPPLETQRRIADILSAYDDLIENNQKQIKLLEEAAQRLYREWFVELRFPGHEMTPVVDGVPEGWERVTLEEVVAFDPKVTLNKARSKQFVPMTALSTNSMSIDLDAITYTESCSGSKFQNGDTLLARITPCLENGKTAFVDCIEDAEGAVGSTEYIVMRSIALNPYMVYCLARTGEFRQEAINSMTGSDGRQRAQKDKLKSLPYVKPAAALVEAFEHCVKPMFEQVAVLQRQVQQLRNARDMLLPQLMSGEVEV